MNEKKRESELESKGETLMLHEKKLCELLKQLFSGDKKSNCILGHMRECLRVSVCN